MFKQANVLAHWLRAFSDINGWRARVKKRGGADAAFVACGAIDAWCVDSTEAYVRYVVTVPTDNRLGAASFSSCRNFTERPDLDATAPIRNVLAMRTTDG